MAYYKTVFADLSHNCFVVLILLITPKDRYLFLLLSTFLAWEAIYLNTLSNANLTFSFEQLAESAISMKFAETVCMFPHIPERLIARTP